MPWTRRWVGKTVSPGSLEAAEVDHERVGAEVAHRAALVPVRERRLVAVVAVGDVDRPVAERLGHALGGGAGDGGAPVRVAVAVVRLAPGRGRQPGRRRGEQALDRAVVVGEEQEDRAEVGVRGPVQAQPVDLGAGVRALVRQHHALVQGGQPEPRDEAPAGAFAAVRPRVRLVHDDDARQLVAHEHALLAPAAERGRRASRTRHPSPPRRGGPAGPRGWRCTGSGRAAPRPAPPRARRRAARRRRRARMSSR